MVAGNWASFRSFRLLSMWNLICGADHVDENELQHNGYRPRYTTTQVHGGSRAIYRLLIGFGVLPAVLNSTVVVRNSGEWRS